MESGTRERRKQPKILSLTFDSQSEKNSQGRCITTSRSLLRERACCALSESNSEIHSSRLVRDSRQSSIDNCPGKSDCLSHGRHWSSVHLFPYQTQLRELYYLDHSPTPCTTDPTISRKEGQRRSQLFRVLAQSPQDGRIRLHFLRQRNLPR